MPDHPLRPALAVGAVGLLLSITGCASDPASGPASGPASAPTGPGAASATAAPPAPASPTPAAPRAAPGRTARATDVVAWWDERRATAWRQGDVDALRAAYAPGSTTGDVDARRLGAYVDAGVRVVGWQTQRLAVREVQRSGTSLVVRVLARQVSTRVRPARGPGTRRLPQQAVRRLEVSLVWAPPSGWTVERVSPISPSGRPGPPAARPRRPGGRS